VNKKRFYPVIYSTVVVAVVLAFVVSVCNTTNKRAEEEQSAADAGSVSVDDNTGAAAVAKNEAKSYREMTQTETSTESTTAAKVKEKTAVVEPVPKTASVPTDEPKYTLFDDGEEMSWPVEGRILMDYSVETAVYDETLDQYRTNDSLCIEAGADTEVCAAADGIVEAISNDRVNGNMVVLDHGNGWRTTYSQLRDDISVTEGEVVCRGETVGRVGTPSAYSEALGTHLTFTVSKDNNSIDPKLVLENEE
jgi:murein DD-endopeptidase MepM/ murein hydrolase activator NlpD